MAGLNETPKANRVHIGFFGCRNAGKSASKNDIVFIAPLFKAHLIVKLRNKRLDLAVIFLSIDRTQNGVGNRDLILIFFKQIVYQRVIGKGIICFA